VLSWVPLAQSDRPAEVVLRECRAAIDRLAPPRERDNFLVVTQLLGRLRYKRHTLETIFGGWKAMIESPMLQDIADDIRAEIADKVRAEEQADTRRKDILRVLTVRFTTVAPEIATALQRVDDTARLDELIDWAVRCPDLDAFRQRL
jgi:hypothetical protein